MLDVRGDRSTYRSDSLGQSRILPFGYAPLSPLFPWRPLRNCIPATIVPLNTRTRLSPQTVYCDPYHCVLYFFISSLQCPELSQRRSRTDKLSISACFGRGFQALQLSFKSQMV